MAEENAPINEEVELSDEELFNAEKLESLQELEEQIITEKAVLEIGKATSRLANNKDFKKVIAGAFLKEGKEYLWENIRKNREADLLEKGSARTENITRFETELQARLIIERFINSCLDDVEQSAAKVSELEAMKLSLQNTKFNDDESEE